ncbi:hypothetical protein HPB48_009114 [Haemaphysalis longicornis]|uniref:Uncharacterized protein n=1 Tax=Haemaphysalis longicornis TaxID=44386 RepID=A0A9J6FPC1_HAELO|nr:hypothetical protein HPB48_009114 [Haemaphysalis longicornis]
MEEKVVTGHVRISFVSDFKWDIIDNPYGSDYLHVLIWVTSSPTIMPTKPGRWKLQFSDWGLFTSEANLDQAFSDTLSIDELDGVFTSDIVNAARIAIPQSKGVVRKNHNV